MYKLKLGVAGVGRWGQNILRNYMVLPCCEVIAIADPADKGKEVASQRAPGIKLVDTLDDLLNEDIEAVSIASPAVTHYEYVKKALTRGLHVFVEKPLATKLSEANELVELALLNNKNLFVGHVLKYHPAMTIIRQELQRAELGELFAFQGIRGSFGQIRHTGSIIWELGPHDILNTILLLNKGWPSSVICVGGDHLRQGIYDHATIVLFFKNTPVIPVMHLSWLYPIKRREVILIGSRGMLQWDDVAAKVLLHPKWGEPLLDINKNEITMHHEYATRQLEIPAQEPLAKELETFCLECLDPSTILEENIREGAAIVAVLEAAEKSCNNYGKEIEISY